MGLWQTLFGGTGSTASGAAPISSDFPTVKPTFESVALAGNGVVARSGAPFPFNKIMPYDATGGQKLYRAYQQSPWVQRAIKKISGPIAAVSIDFTLDDKAFDDPGLAAFWQKPGIRLTKHDFIEATVGWLKLEGEAFWILDDSSLVPFPDQRGRELCPIIVARPDRMFLHQQNGTILGWDYVDAQGKHHGLLPEQVIQIKAWNPYDEFRGLAEMLSAKDAAEADFFAGKYAKNQFANNGDRGPFIIAKSGIPNDTQRQMIVDQIREKRELSQRGVFKPLFLSGDISIEDPKVQAPDATFIAARLANRHEIALAFGVPPSMFDVKASYSIGSASDWFMLISETCIPTSQKIAQAINAVLSNQTGKPVCASFNWDEHPVIQTVRRERWDTATKMWSMGVPLETINGQLDLKLPECPGWKTGYVAATLVPVDTLPPEKNPDYAEPSEDNEDKLDKMRRVLEPLARMKSMLAAPSPEQRPACCAGSCAARIVDAGLKTRTANARELALWRGLQLKRASTRTAYLSKIGRVLMEARAETKSKLERYAKSIEAGGATQTRAVAADLVFDLDKFKRKLCASVRPVTENALNQAGSELYQEIGLEDPFKYPPEAALRFIEQRENRLSNVGHDVWDSVRDLIHDGLTDGDSIKTISDAVSGKFNEISKGRAKTIAITETGMAYETARHTAMKSAGIGWKRWLTSGNPNVRPAHDDAEGQIVAVDEPFIVDDEELRFPCDPDGSPENVINCHCVSLPEANGPDDDDEDET